MAPIKDHPLRYQLTNELHARPFPSMPAPCTVVFVAIKRVIDAAGRDKDQDIVHLIELLDRHGATHPQPGATHYSGTIGRHHLKWEQHTEFVTYTVFSEGLSDRAFDPADFSVLPEDWLSRAPGLCVTSAMIRVDRGCPDDQLTTYLNDWFVAESTAVAHVVDGAAIVAGDFRIDPAGHLRFAVFVADGVGQRRIGRIVQRLCEIETYKTMSMLGFSRVRALGSRMSELDAALTQVMEDMTGGSAPAEETLDALLEISAQLEALAAQSSYRFGATGAYSAIVAQRIEVMREARFLGRQTFDEFMMRRYEPAMRTVKSSQQRLDNLADRAIRAGELLRTRVDVERSAQNQQLLESMDARADMQLRLQQTVEGLSVVAISYYAVSLAGYLLYPATEITGLSVGTLKAAVTLPVVALVWWMVRRIRGRIE